MSTLTTTAAPRSLHDLGFSELQGTLAAAGVNPFHTSALWGALHREAELDLASRADFSPPLQRWVNERVGAEKEFFLDQPTQSVDTHSSDGLTRKFLLRLEDGQTIETVLMGYTGRFTACVSTQAGCAMGCVFCATGQMGFTRHLRAGEIVAQVLHAQRALRAAGEPDLRNLVLMGMGEPLHNYDAVLSALATISHTGGPNIGPSRITISTVGVVPGILRLAEEKAGYHLAVSLHGATEEERSALVPASRKWPLAEVIAACRTYMERTKRRVFFAWTLIAGTNDSPAHAARLATLLHGMDAHVNLIPLNLTDGYAGQTAANSAADIFQQVLRAAGIPTTVRQRRGIDVAAGCGQLRAEKTKTDEKRSGYFQHQKTIS